MAPLPPGGWRAARVRIAKPKRPLACAGGQAIRWHVVKFVIVMAPPPPEAAALSAWQTRQRRHAAREV